MFTILAKMNHRKYVNPAVMLRFAVLVAFYISKKEGFASLLSAIFLGTSFVHIAGI